MIKLQIAAPGHPERYVELTAPRSTIGRSGRAGLHLDDPFSSRLHAEIWFDGTHYWLSDLGSSNGTYFNGQTMAEPVRLAALDEIVVGETRLRVHGFHDPAQGSGTFRALPGDSEETSGDGVSGAEALLETVFTQVARSSPRGGARAPEREELLSVISKVGVALLSPASLEEVLYEIMELVFDLTLAERAFILLCERPGRPEVRLASYRDGGRVTELETLLLSRTIQYEVLEKGRSVVTSDAMDDQRFAGRDSVELSGMRSVMAVPLSSAGEVFGMIEADSAVQASLFGDDELELLTALGSVAAVKVENTILLEHRLEHERLQQELESARRIQARLFPFGPPELAGYDVRGISLPCQAVGGDYFDFIPLGPGELLIAIGDVSGKGLDAALLMSSLHAAVRAQAAPGARPAELVSRVDQYLLDASPRNKFATLFCARLDADRHRLRFANAGHNPPILLRADGEVVRLEATGAPAGSLPGSQFVEQEVAFPAGSLLVAYTDGLTEASGPAGGQFGEDRLIAVLDAHRHLSPARLRDRVDEALMSFTGNRALDDDLTLVLVKRSG